MSQAWSQLRDIDRLSDGRVDIEFVIPLSEFPKLPAQPAGAGGSVSGRAQFRRDMGFAIAQLDVAGCVQLVCQRCLAPMSQPVNGSVQIALVATEAEADRVPPEFEPVRAPEGRIRVRDLVEEEVLLSMPIVPLHEDPADCAPVALVAEPQAEVAESMQKPFQQLGELLKRK